MNITINLVSQESMFFNALNIKMNNKESALIIKTVEGNLETISLEQIADFSITLYKP